MKSEWRRVFKSAAAQAASKCGVQFGFFMGEWGLEDFLTEAFDQAESPQEVAARALERLCAPGGRREKVVCLTVAQFLNETVGPPPADRQLQRFRDLRQVVQSPASYDAYLQWARAWYP